MSATKLLNKLEVDALKKEELAAYAQDHFGISLDATKKKGEMLAAFEKGGGKYADEVEDKEDPNKAIGGKALTLPAGVKQKDLDSFSHHDPRHYPRHDVTIHASEGPGGNNDVFLAVNGYALQIKRDHKVSIPLPHLLALRNMKKTIYERVGEGRDAKNVKRVVPTYAFTEHGPTEDAED